MDVEMILNQAADAAIEAGHEVSPDGSFMAIGPWNDPQNLCLVGAAELMFGPTPNRTRPYVAGHLQITPSELFSIERGFCGWDTAKATSEDPILVHRLDLTFFAMGQRIAARLASKKNQ